MSVVPSRVPIPLPSDRQLKRPDFLDLNNALAGLTTFAAQTLDVAVAAGKVKGDIEGNEAFREDLNSQVRQAEQRVEIQKGRRDIVQQQLFGEDLKRKHDELSDLQDFDVDFRIANSTEAQVIDHLNTKPYLNRKTRLRLSSASGTAAASKDYLDIGLAEKRRFREDEKNLGKKFDWEQFVKERLAARGVAANARQPGTQVPPDWARAYQQRLMGLATANQLSEANAVGNARQKMFFGQAQDSIDEAAALNVQGQDADVHLHAVHLAELGSFQEEGKAKDDAVLALEKAAWLKAVHDATKSMTATSGPLGTAEAMLTRASPEVAEAIFDRVNKALTDWQTRLDTRSANAWLAYANRQTGLATTPTELNNILGIIEAMPEGDQQDEARIVWKKKKEIADRTEGLIEEIDAVLRGDAVRSSPTTEKEIDAVNKWWLRNVTDPNAHNGQPYDEQNAAIALITVGYGMPEAMVKKLTAAISDPTMMNIGFAADFMYSLASATNMPTAVVSMRALGDQGQMLERHVRATANMSQDRQRDFADRLAERLQTENAPGQEDDRQDAYDLVWGTKDSKGNVITTPVEVGKIMNQAMLVVLEQQTPRSEDVPKGLDIRSDRTVMEFNTDFRQELGQAIEYFYFLNQAPFANKEERLRGATRQAVDIVDKNWSGVYLDGQLKMLPRVFDIGPISGATREVLERAAPAHPTGFSMRGRPKERQLVTESYAQRFHQHTRIAFDQSQPIFREAFGGHAQWDTQNSFESNTVPATFNPEQDDHGPRHGVIIVYDSITNRPRAYYVFTKEGLGQGTLFVDEDAPLTFQSDVVDFITTSRQSIDEMVRQARARTGRSFRPNSNLTRPDNLPATSVEGAHFMLLPTHDLAGDFERAGTLLFTGKERRPPSTPEDQLMIDGFIEDLASRHNWASVGQPDIPQTSGGTGPHTFLPDTPEPKRPSIGPQP